MAEIASVKRGKMAKDKKIETNYFPNENAEREEKETVFDMTMKAASFDDSENGASEEIFAKNNAVDNAVNLGSTDDGVASQADVEAVSISVAKNEKTDNKKKGRKASNGAESGKGKISDKIVRFIKKPIVKNIFTAVFYPLCSISLIFIIWAIAASAIGKPLLLPAPGEVLKVYFSMLGEKEIWIYGGWTLLRTLECFIISAVIAFILSILAAFAKPVHKIFSPIITILRAAPTLAVILLILIWVDYAYAPVIIGFLIAFPILYSAFYSAITGVDENLLKMGKSFKLSKKDVIRFIYIPSISKPCLDSMKSTVSLTAKVVIATEIMALTKKSIGLLMRTANLSFDTANLLALTIFAVVLSFILEGVFSLIIKITEVVR
ncbi:MAG: ABC transporter permease [Christensenellales bacterium]